MDTLNAEQRSLNMAKIHSKDTKPEVFLRSALHWECSITGKQKEQKLSKVTEEISLWLEEDLTENYREF